MPGCQSCQGDELPPEPPLATHICPSSRRGQAPSTICTGQSNAQPREHLPREQGRAFFFKQHHLETKDWSSSLGGSVFACWQPPLISGRAEREAGFTDSFATPSPAPHQQDQHRPCCHTRHRAGTDGLTEAARQSQHPSSAEALYHFPVFYRSVSSAVKISHTTGRPQAHSLANLLPTSDRSLAAPPGQARNSPLPFSLRLRPCLPKASTAHWGKPTHCARAAWLSSTLSGVKP